MRYWESVMGTESDSVLFVGNEVPDQAGTTRYQHAFALCESFETTVLCGGDVPPSVREIAADVRTFPASVWPALPLLFPLWLLYWTLRTSASVTVVSPHGLYVLLTFLGTRLSTSRLVVDFWDDLTLPVASYAERDGMMTGLKERYHRALVRVARRCLARIDLLVLSIHPGVVEKYDLESVPVLELTNGYNPTVSDIEQPDCEDDEVRFVYLGRANAKRGIDQLVRIVAEAVPAHCLDVVGPTDPAVELVAAEFDNVTLHGERPHEEALRLAARGDVGLCILDTSVENYRYSYPIKLFEYAALGTTVLASDTPATRSVLTDGESAVLVDGRSQLAIRDAVTTLATNADRRQQLGRNARNAVREYEWPEILDRYTEAVEELAVRE